VGVIEETLRLLEPELLRNVLDKVNDYEMSIPRMDVEVSREMIEEKTAGRFESIRNWFVAGEGRENEAGRLFDATNEIIRRITRYAAQLSEKNALGANRREEYRSEEHTSELQSRFDLVCRLLLEKKKREKKLY